MNIEVATTSELSRNWIEAYIEDKNTVNNEFTNHFFEPVICGVENCGKSYCNKYVLQEHIAKVHQATKKKSDVDKKHKCDEPGCNAAFSRPYRLKNHKLSVHQGEKPFTCDFKDCDKSYSNESHLARHKRKCHLSEEKERNFEEVICENEGCGRVFANRYSLKKHLFTSHTVLPFSCKECGENFKRKSHLHVHKVETHNGDAPYKCIQCPKTFIHLHLYNKHLKNHKTYKCDCDMTFDRWSKLLKHKKSDCTITIKKKNYKCVICDKVFSQKSHLSLHSQKVHIPDSQVDLFKCPYLSCTKSYKYEKNLKHHVKFYHEKCFQKVKCTECNVVLKSNKNLKQHIRIVHSGLKPKIRKPRKPRKDKGLPKKSMASFISSFDVSTEEHKKNISGENKEVNGMSEVEFNKLLEIRIGDQNIIENTTENITEKNDTENITEKNNTESLSSRICNKLMKKNKKSKEKRAKVGVKLAQHIAKIKENVLYEYINEESLDSAKKDEIKLTENQYEEELTSMKVDKNTNDFTDDFEKNCNFDSLDHTVVIFDFPEFEYSKEQFNTENAI